MCSLTATRHGRRDSHAHWPASTSPGALVALNSRSMRIARLESRPTRGVQPGPAQTWTGAPPRAGVWRRAALPLVLVATLALAFAAPSYAANVGEQVILHCTHNESL